MATSPLGGFADLSSARRRVDAAIANNKGLEGLMDSFSQGVGGGVGLANLPQAIQNQALERELATALQQAKLRELQQGKTIQIGNSIVVQDPITGEYKSVYTAPTATKPPSPFKVNDQLIQLNPETGKYESVFSAPAKDPKVTYNYETREDGTYAIPSSDPLNAFRVSVAGSQEGLLGKPTAQKAAKWTYETREDGTYAISSDDPLKAVRVSLKDGSLDPAGANAVSSSQMQADPTFMPGKPKAGGKSAKLSEDEKKLLLSGVSQSKIIPGMVTEFRELEKANLAGPVAGKIQQARVALGYGGTEFTQAQSKIKGNLFKLARALQGGGVLTEGDINRMEEIAPPLDVQEAQFVGGMRGVAALMRDNLQTFVELNGGRLDSEALNGVTNAITELNQFIKPTSSPVATPGINPNAPAPVVQEKKLSTGLIIRPRSQ